MLSINALIIYGNDCWIYSGVVIIIKTNVFI